MRNFALIGAAGYVASRHMKAIKDTGNTLIAALDKHDNVGILDSYFPSCHFFTEFERFDRHLDKLKRKGESLDYVSICTPNYLHDSHVRFSLKHGAHAICEKPLVLNPWNLDSLAEIEMETGKRVFAILQLRLHPAIISLKKKIDSMKEDKIFDIDLQYITSRGNWYYNSWKGDAAKSGGIVSNIGIHFFDMLIWIFGPVKSVSVSNLKPDSGAGSVELERAHVKWRLSINYDHLPDDIKAMGGRTFRSLTLNGEQLEFSEGFTELHTKGYESILRGEGFGLADARPSIDLVYKIRNAI